MCDGDIELSELRRRFQAVCVERDNATLALSSVEAEYETKLNRVRAHNRELATELAKAKRTANALLDSVALLRILLPRVAILGGPR